MQTSDYLGAITAIVILVLSIAVFLARLFGRSDIGRTLGYLLFVTSIPLLYLLGTAPSLGRERLYYLQIALMLCFLLVMYVVDYSLKLDFRNTRWAVVSYVMVYFAGTGGMVGVASLAGTVWTIVAVVLFLVMAGLAFYQRQRTGM